MSFKIALFATGNNPADWSTLDSLDISEPDAPFQPYAETVRTLAGGGYGRGFASAIWILNLRNPQRATLRAFCPSASSQVYISTSTNEDDSSGDPVFKNYLAEMHWPSGQEDKQIRTTLDIEITFSHLVEIV